MDIKNIAVLGAGTMGNGIAHVFAQYGFAVTLIDTSQTQLEAALANISKNIDRQIKKGIIEPAQKETIIGKINPIVSLNNCPKNIDLAIEAIYENKEAKSSLFKELNNILPTESIFASNTSSISITELADCGRPDRFIGMHFMNPVPVMELVEVIKGYQTSPETVETIINLVQIINKTPVEVNDYPGFISNRVLMPMINEAIFALYEGVATTEQIDKIMTFGMNHPMGPLKLADFIGLDVCLNIMEVLYNGFKDSKYRPCPLLVKMVNARKLGVKTKEGFYKYGT